QVVADLDPLQNSLVAWSTNRVAFNTANKLYVLDTTAYFLPADLEITQVVATNVVPFGANAVFTVTVTNKGPGAAVDVILTNSLDGSTNLIGSTSFPPGAVYQKVIAVRSTELGTLSNVATLSTQNDPNTSNNSSTETVSVVRPGRVSQ